MLCVFPNSVSCGLIYMLVHVDTIVSCSFVRSSTSLVRRGKMDGLECFAGVKMLILVTMLHTDTLIVVYVTKP